MTEFIVTGRGAGKTHEVLEKMIRDPESVYIAHSNAAADQTCERFIELLEEREGKTIARNSIRRGPIRARFMGPHRATEYLRGRRVTMHVDNVELVLYALFGQVPETITGTGTTTTIRPLNTEAPTHD